MIAHRRGACSQSPGLPTAYLADTSPLDKVSFPFQVTKPPQANTEGAQELTAPYSPAMLKCPTLDRMMPSLRIHKITLFLHGVSRW